MTGRFRRDRWTFLFLAIVSMASPVGRAEADDAPAAAYAIVEPPASWKIDPYYRKGIDLRGMPIVASARVSDHALREAAYLVDRMLSGRPDLLAAMVKNRARLVVMAYDERTTDLPEQRDMKPKEFWDVRARGLGATKSRPTVSCAEENLLNYPGDPYKGENILIHEFAHAIHGLGLDTVDPEFDGRLRKVYEASIAAGRWKGTYAATNRSEYWAEAVQSWFDCNLDPPDFQHNDVRTREALKAYDPEVAKLVADVFGDTPWRYVPPDRRTGPGLEHLAGFDPAKSPTFSWGVAKKKYDEVVAEKRALRRREQEKQSDNRKSEDRP